MSDSLPIFIQMGALPSSVKWTPQQLADAMVARMSLVTAQTFALFVSGSTEPSSNVGPWLKNGSSWWVYSDVFGAYTPITIPQESLGYFVGNAEPSPVTTQFWIQTTPTGEPQALKIYYSGAWTDVYASAFAGFLTIAAFNTAIAAYTNTTGMNTAISNGDAATLAASEAYTDAAIADIPPQTPFASYPAVATISGTQSIATDGTPVKVALATATINPSPAPFDTAQNRYVAPAAGIYAVGATSQFDNDTGTAATMEIGIGVYKNGSDAGIGDLDSTPSPVGARWSPGFGGILISLAQNDYLELFATPDDGGSHLVDLTTVRFSVWRVSA